MTRISTSKNAMVLMCAIVITCFLTTLLFTLLPSLFVFVFWEFKKVKKV